MTFIARASRLSGPLRHMTRRLSRRRSYPGDYPRVPEMTYGARPDGMADPGEVVWAWVPYEEDHARGKDRPALVVARETRRGRDWLLALPMTSKDHDRDLRQEAAAGRHWADVGSGPWDRGGRPSEVRVDRIVRLDPRAVRREGGCVSPGVFDDVAREVARYH